MDAIQLLTADHNRVRGLFARFTKAEESEDTAQMTELAVKIVEELEIHTTIEEEIFYPAVKDASEEVAKLVAEGLEEHGVAKTLIAEVGEVEHGGEQWVAKMTVLIESVKHHAEEEETEMFPGIRSGMDATTLEDLGARLEARKKELGAPTAEDAMSLTKKELSQKATEQEIPGRSSMSHDELAATVDPR